MFLTNADWQEYEDSVSDHSTFVIGDSVLLIISREWKIRQCK